MRNGLRLVGLAMALSPVLLIAGCATIEMGQFEDIPVTTKPPGASVSSTTGSSCVTPCVVSGPRGEDIVIYLQKPGYEPATVVSLHQRIKGTDAVTSTAPSLDYVGRIVDVKSGTIYQHVPNAFDVTLVPKK